LDIFGELFTQLKAPNMYFFVTPESKKLHFNSDLIHLTPKCGEQYVQSLFDQASELFANVSRYSSTVSASKSPQPASSSLSDLGLFRKALTVDTDTDSLISESDDNDVTVVEKNSSPITLDLLYSEI